MDGFGNGSQDLLGLGQDAEAGGEEQDNNPWQDTRSRLSRAQTAPAGSQRLQHRLSFDHATGVINLPDDDWLEIDDSSDDEAEGDSGPDTAGLENSVGELTASPTAETGPGVGSSAAAGSSTLGASPSKRRYGTYYHHPEKRRQPIPGAFPR